MKQSYKVFISYSHQNNTQIRLDGKSDCVLWADKIYNYFQDYQTPSTIVGNPSRYGWPIPKRPYPIFRDQNELPTSSNLEYAILEALDNSDILLVICSPRSAKSFYVNQEILQFKMQGKADRIVGIIIDGEPNASDKGFDALKCFPEALRFKVDEVGKIDLEHRNEPIAADVRIDGVLICR